MLELRDLVKHHVGPGGDTVRAVDGVSLTVGRGEMAVVYGPSGSGKTTLLMLVAALLRPDAGQVLVDGRDVTRLPPKDAARYRRLEMGFVRQSLDLLPGVPAVDNAALKLFDDRHRVRDAHRKVIPLLERLGLGERLRSRAEQLSMGERQRVLIARALSTGPTLLLADEPTGSLDAERSEDVLRLLTEVCRERGVAMLLVTHDAQAADYADQVLMLRDGRLHETGGDGSPACASER